MCSPTSGELSRKPGSGELEVEPGSLVHSPREYFHSYLQSLDVERAGLTGGFQAKLKQALRAPLRSRRPGPHAGAGIRGLPDLPCATANVGRRRDRVGTAAAVARRTRARTVGAGDDRPRAGARGRGHPGAVPRGGRSRPQRGVPMVRAADAASEACRALRACGATSVTSTPTRTRPTAPSGSRDGLLLRTSGTGARPADPPTGRGSRPAVGGQTRRYYGDRALSEVTGESAGCRCVTAEHTGSGGVTRVVSTAVDPRGGRRHGAVGRVRRGRRRTGLVVDLYVLVGPAGRRRDGGAARRAPRRAAVARTCAVSPRPSAGPAGR